MTQKIMLASGMGALALAWLGPLPGLARHAFAAHMTMHMIVVAVAAPLIAVGLSGTALDPARRLPRLFAPIQASMIELAVVWSWHAPLLHQAARTYGSALVLEQASFAAAGLLLWIAAVCGSPDRRAAGVAALLFTSMHMTLLGALFAVADRPLFAHGAAGAFDPARLDDQHLGGAIMLLVGGVSYLAGGIALTGSLLRAPAAARRRVPR